MANITDGENDGDAGPKSNANRLSSNPHFGGGKSDFAMQLKWNVRPDKDTTSKDDKDGDAMR